jgi:hypothetical protein
MCLPELDVCISQHQEFWLEVMLLTESKDSGSFPIQKITEDEMTPPFISPGSSNYGKAQLLKDLTEGDFRCKPPPKVLQQQ